MTMARAHLVAPAVSGWYHYSTRYVQRAFLLGDEYQDLKASIERGLQQLANIFAMSGWLRKGAVGSAGIFLLRAFNQVSVSVRESPGP
jgi:hypothetical protein